MFKENTQSYHILALICMCGECSEKALSILIPQKPYRNKLISTLITQKMITRYQKNDLLGFRLTRTGKKMILQTTSERFDFFLLNGADYSMRRSSVSYRIRQHRISETLAMMKRAEIEIYRDNKNDIFEETPKHTDKTTSSAFYLAKEVKAQEALTRKIISSKMNGIWVTEDAAWLCYQSANEQFWWFDNIERRAEILMHSMLQSIGLHITYCDALLLGNTIEQAKIFLDDHLMRNYISRTSFQRFCYIQMDENGIMLLKLLNNSDLYNHLLSILAEDLHPKEDAYIIHDGFNSDGLPVLICIDCDLKRLAAFRTQLYYSRKYGEVICFDFQEDGIKEFCGENISFSTVDSDIIREIFFNQ